MTDMRARILCLLAVCAVVPAAAAQPLADRLPADEVLYVGWAGRSMPFEGSMLGQLLNEPAVGSLFGTLYQAAEQNLDSEPDRELFRHGWALAAIAWQHPAALTMDLRAGETEPAPEGLLLMDLGRDKPRFAEHVDALGARLAEQMPVEQGNLGGVSYRSIPVPDVGEVSFGFLENLFFVRLGPGGPQGLVGLEPAASLAQNADFQRRMAAVGGEDVQIAFHLDAAALERRVAELFGEQTANDVQKAMTAMGLDGVSAVAGTTRIVDRGMYTRSRIFSPAPHRGMLSLLAGAELTDEDLAAVPADADFVCAANVSAAEAYVELRRAVRENGGPEAEEQMLEAVGQFEQSMGVSLTDDVLAPLGDTWVMASAPSYGGFVTGTVVTVELTDAPKMKQTVAAIEDQLRPLVGPATRPETDPEPVGPVRLQTTTVDRTEIHYLNSASSDVLLPVAPAWVVGEDKLYVAGFPQVAAAAAGGAPERPLADSPAYQAAREHIQRRPSVLCYVNTPKVLRQTYHWLLIGWTTGANALAGFANVPARPDWLPSLPALEKYLWPQVTAVSADEDGITFESYGSLPGGALFGSPVLSPATPAAVVPALAHARAKARRVVSMTNLRGIGIAMQMYAAEHDEELPPDFAVLVEGQYVSAPPEPGRESIFTSPAGDRRPGFRDGEMVGECDYVYAHRGLRLTDIRYPGSFVVAYERPENYDGKGTVVLFADGHAEWLDREHYDSAMRETERMLNDRKGGEDF
jgi:prepilin-type processing-associated H-X9-DG protein